MEMLKMERGQILGRTNEEVFGPEVTSQYLPALERCAQEKATQTLEVSITLPGGSYVRLLSFVPILGGNGELRQILGIGYDITERRRAEEQVEEALKKEVILRREIQHRVKNSIQIISSLLNMQINGVSDQDARNALRSSQNRVRAIAALHQHLYQVALGKADTFSDFSRDLVSHLRECYEVQSDQIKVLLEVQEGPVEQEWLMPLALTLNEALSNCFEHAYPHGRHGQITAMLHYSQGSGELVVRDDGVGLPAGFNPGEGGGLGLKILAVFADQMRGQLFVQGRPDQGTEIRLRFPLVSPEG